MGTQHVGQDDEQNLAMGSHGDFTRLTSDVRPYTAMPATALRQPSL